MTASPSPEPVPPAAQTTAAEAGLTEPPAVVPRRPDLTQRPEDQLVDPRPATVVTQEIRLALAFTGGVSLAVWMGGVARELDLLVQASARRRRPGLDPVDPATPDPDPGRRAYRRLLDLVDAQVAVDVLAGTSAGGINAALLGLASARGLTLEKLRDIWLEAGAFDKLLRDPREEAPPSLLKGDGQMLAALSAGIDGIVGDQPPPAQPRLTDVFITTTLLSPETSTFSDDYGTLVVDSDHHGLFHFDESALCRRDVRGPLALAARSSASFPAAFEPSYVRFGDPAGARQDPTHPDMGDWSNTSRSHWAADGGLLVNRPIGPLLQTVFDREADREVRRALLYVVPTSGPGVTPPEDRQNEPLPLATSLVRDLTATLNQSIAADLAAIKEHNDRTRAVSDTRLRLVDLANRLPDGEPVADPAAWRDYRDRQGAWLVAPLVSEVGRQVAARGADRPAAWAAAPEQDQDAVLRAVARDAVTAGWPAGLPAVDGALAGAAALGRPAFDSAQATLLRLFWLGAQLATTVDERNALSKRGMYAHRALAGARRTDLREFVRDGLGAPGAEELALAGLVTRLATAYAAGQGTTAALESAWASLAETFRRAFPLLAGLAARADGAFARELGSYLRFFGSADGFRTGGDLVRRLLDLHVAVRSVLPVLQEVEQRVELIQVSADTRTALAPGRASAGRKLTGMQLSHFGAFYKASWRANDWMWGRLDGCGWLVHVLLDPRRIVAVLENDGVAPADRAAEFTRRLGQALDTTVPPAVAAGLAFLSDGSPPPRSLPEVAVWAASVMQGPIAAEELPAVVAQLAEEGKRDRNSAAVAAWLSSVHGVDWRTASAAKVADLLRSCPVPDETLAQERDRGTGTFLRTSSHTIAVATSAATGLRKPPASLRPTFATARTITRGAYVALDKIGGERPRALLAGAGFLVVGVLAALTSIGWLEAAGLAAIGVAALLLALSLTRGVKAFAGMVVVIALLVLAFAPLIDLVWSHVTSWLEKTAIPGMHDHPWIWPVVLFVLLLPPLTLAADVVRGRTAYTRAPAAPPPPPGARGGVAAVPSPRPAPEAPETVPPR